MADKLSDVLEPKNESHDKSRAVHPTHTVALNNHAVHTASLNIWNTLSQNSSTSFDGLLSVVALCYVEANTSCPWMGPYWRTERGEEDYRTWLAETLWALQAKVYKLNALNNLVWGHCCIKPLSMFQLVSDKKKQTLLCLVSRSTD